MKSKATFVLSLGAICVAFLSGCKSKNRFKVPTTPYEKVSVALNGVTESFNNYKNSEKSSSSKTRSAQRIKQTDPSGALTIIANIYKSYDSQGDKIDDLEYDEPPMIQFQCLKKVYETIGSSYSFGTKYTDTINGVAYFDPTTGEKKEESNEFKYDYNFTLSLSLDIDSNDLISADISFNIDLTQGQTTLESNWYVAISLDYNMTKELPNYTMSMYTDNEESDFAYLKYGNTYEYDFVDMKDGRVNEWRKFCYESNQRMVKDDNHPSFSSYISDPQFKCQIGASKWYKNADLRKITHPNTSKTNDFVGALFDKFGLNTTEINAQAFTSKSGTQNSAIKQMYQEFSRIFAQDVIYNLITGSANREEVKTDIQVRDSSVSQKISHIQIEKDTNFNTLFNGEEGNYGIWYFDKNEEALEQVEDLNTINFSFTIPYGTSGSAIFDKTYLNEDISALYESLGKENYEARHQNAYVIINDGQLNAIVEISIGDSIRTKIDLFFRSIFPEDLLSLGFVKYDGETCLFDYRDDIQMVLDISQTTANELAAYKNKLESLSWSKEEGENVTRYSRLINNKTKLLGVTIEENATALQSGNVRMLLSVEDIQSVAWPRDDIKTKSHDIFDLPEPHTENGYFETRNDMEDTIILSNFTSDEISAFIETLETQGVKTNGESINALYVSKDNQIYKFDFNVGPTQITFCYNPDNTIYHEYELTIEEEGSAETTLIPLALDLSNYYYEGVFEPGTYKVNKHDKFDDSNSYMPMENYGLDCYDGKVTYNESTRTLTVTQQVKIVFYADVSSTEFLTLLENN